MLVNRIHDPVFYWVKLASSLLLHKNMAKISYPAFQRAKSKEKASKYWKLQKMAARVWQRLPDTNLSKMPDKRLAVRSLKNLPVPCAKSLRIRFEVEKNYSDKWIIRAKSIWTTNIRDHTRAISTHTQCCYWGRSKILHKAKVLVPTCLSWGLSQHSLTMSELN